MRFAIALAVALIASPALAQERHYTIVLPASQLQKLIDMLNKDPEVMLLQTLIPQINEQNQPKVEPAPKQEPPK